MPRQKRSAQRCVCGHHMTLHAMPARRSDGLGACVRGVGCSCERFITPGQRRMNQYRAQHAESVRLARAAYALVEHPCDEFTEW